MGKIAGLPLDTGLVWPLQTAAQLKLGVSLGFAAALLGWLTVAAIVWAPSAKATMDCKEVDESQSTSHKNEALTGKEDDAELDTPASACGSGSASITESTEEDQQVATSHWKPSFALVGMKDARKVYPLLLPVWVSLVILSLCFQIKLVTALIDTGLLSIVIEAMPYWCIRANFISAVIASMVKYIFHYYRLRGSMELQKNDVPEDPLFHVVVIVAYQEPLEVLHRTLNSILEQTGIAKAPTVVFATEARDATRHACAWALGDVCKDRGVRFVFSEHTLVEGETIGKHSNENWAVRELFQQLVETEGMDPFKVMLTIVDADSLVSKTYCANVESHFHAQRDGRRLIYSGPLNTYRNFASGGLLSQYYETWRCNDDLYADPTTQYYPQSNYSLTLGLLHETEYWQNDVMHEDIHTANKASVNNLGSTSTVPITGLICNDLVTSFGDRYVQAKRHMWGITGTAWLWPLFWQLNVPFTSYWSSVKGELNREGSFLGSTVWASKRISFVYFAYLLFQFPGQLSPKATAILSSLFAVTLLRWVAFWMSELILWRTLMRQFSVEAPSYFNAFVLVLLSPLLHVITEMAFVFIPVLHCLFHAAFYVELMYICAPKGDAGSSRSRPAVAA